MSDENKEVEQEVYRRNPINWILIGLITILAVLLIIEVVKINQIPEETLTTEPTTSITENIPELTLEMFESESLLLKFNDVTIGITKPEIREFYEELTGDLSNFRKTNENKYIPAEHIFELKFEDTKTSIYFYNEKSNVTDSFCTVVQDGVIVGNYCVSQKYFEKIFEVIYMSDDLSTHTENLLKEQIPSLIDNQEEISVKLDENYKVTEGDVLVTAFNSMVKNKEEATIVFNMNNEFFVVVCYKNYQYYVFVTDSEGKINVAKHYKEFSYNGKELICYNELIHEGITVEQHFETVSAGFHISENYIGLKVGLI